MFRGAALRRSGQAIAMPASARALLALAFTHAHRRLFAVAQKQGWFLSLCRTMASVMFLCPNTGLHSHEWFADDSENGDDAYRAVRCLACQQVHLVNANGKVLGTDEE